MVTTEADSTGLRIGVSGWAKARATTLFEHVRADIPLCASVVALITPTDAACVPRGQLVLGLQHIDEAGPRGQVDTEVHLAAFVVEPRATLPNRRALVTSCPDTPGGTSQVGDLPSRPAAGHTTERSDAVLPRSCRR